MESPRENGVWWLGLAFLLTLVNITPAFADETEIEEDPEDATREALGPFSIVSDSGDILEIGAAFQLRLLAVASSDDAQDRHLDLSLQVRRGRLIMRSHLLDEKLHMAVQINAVPGDLEVLDVWAEWHFETTRIRVGQWKIPLGRYRDQSFTQLLMNEWPTVAVHFGAERQLGMQWNNHRSARIPFALGVFTGVNSRIAFARGLSEAYAEPLPDPSAGGAIPLTRMHPEVVGKIGFNPKKMNTSTNSDGQPEDGFRAGGFAGAAYDTQPEEARDFVARANLEFLAKFGGVGFDAIAHMGFFKRWDEGAIALGSMGGVVETGYRFLPDHEVTARYGHVQFLDALRNDAKSRSSDIIDSAPPEDQPDLEDKYASAGTTQVQHEMGFGYNFYLIGHYLKSQTEAVYRLEIADEDTINSFVVRTQLLVWF